MMCYTAYSQLIVDSLDDAELFAVEGAGHGVHLEKNGAVLEKMRAFFSKQGSVR